MRKKKVKIKYKDGTLEVDYSGYSISKSSLKARIDHLKPLIDAILTAESSLSNLSSKEVTALRPAIEAQNLVYQFRVYEAAEAALLLERVATGQANIAEHGFPEIGRGSIKDV